MSNTANEMICVMNDDRTIEESLGRCGSETSQASRLRAKKPRRKAFKSRTHTRVDNETRMANQEGEKEGKGKTFVNVTH